MNFRTIGIVGRDFCGSTMLLRLFSAIEGVEPVGELHWLLDAPPDGSIETHAGWPVSRQCVVCGDKCEVFTPEFVTAPHAPETLYGDVAEKLGATTIVSGDKSTMHYERFVPRGEMDAIVLFKSPQAQARSDMTNEDRSFSESLRMWRSTYDHVIQWCIGAKYPRSSIFIAYDQLAAQPLNVMRLLCEHLELPEPPDDLLDKFAESKVMRRYHCIGCSPHSHRRADIVVDKGWEQELTEKQVALCSSGEAGMVLSRLEHLRRMAT